MTLWEIAEKQFFENLSQAQNYEENTLILVGHGNCGKTSLLNKFLDKNETPKPTVALEYTYARKTKAGKARKTVAHIWELGGGCRFLDLLKTVIIPENILSLHVAVVLDLSRPDELWIAVEQIMKALKQRLITVIDATGNQQIHRNRELLFQNHVDKDQLKVLPIPLAFLCSKFDEFQKLEVSKRELITQTLRFLSHYTGASLYYFTLKQESTVNNVKGYFNNILFKIAHSDSIEKSYLQPVCIPSMNDTFTDIGLPPPFSQSALSNSKSIQAFWKKAFTDVFSQKSEKEKNERLKDPSKDEHYREEVVDAAVKKKHEEFVKYKKDCEKKMKALEQAMKNEGLFIV